MERIRSIFRNIPGAIIWIFIIAFCAVAGFVFVEIGIHLFHLNGFVKWLFIAGFISPILLIELIEKM